MRKITKEQITFDSYTTLYRVLKSTDGDSRCSHVFMPGSFGPQLFRLSGSRFLVYSELKRKTMDEYIHGNPADCLTNEEAKRMATENVNAIFEADEDEIDDFYPFLMHGRYALLVRKAR